MCKAKDKLRNCCDRIGATGSESIKFSKGKILFSLNKNHLLAHFILKNLLNDFITFFIFVLRITDITSSVQCKLVISHEQIDLWFVFDSVEK